MANAYVILPDVLFRLFLTSFLCASSLAFGYADVRHEVFWANRVSPVRASAVLPDGEVTVYAQDPESGREPVLLQPEVQSSSFFSELFPVLVSAAVDVVDGQELEVFNAAAGTDRLTVAVCAQDFPLEPLVGPLLSFLDEVGVGPFVGQAGLPDVFGIFRPPLPHEFSSSYFVFHTPFGVALFLTVLAVRGKSWASVSLPPLIEEFSCSRKGLAAF